MQRLDPSRRPPPPPAWMHRDSLEVRARARRERADDPDGAESSARASVSNPQTDHSPRSEKETWNEQDAPARRFRHARRARHADGITWPGRARPQAQVRSREMLRRRQGREKRLPDGQLVVRWNVPA